MKDNRDKTFALNLLRLLEEGNLTMNNLAENSNLHKGSISNFVRNKRQPSFSSIKEIAKALNVNPGEFFKEIKK
jgi:transcriptional regulator with XRE-family HTH domain